MNCLHCNSTRIVEILGKVKDKFEWHDHLRSYQGHVCCPNNIIGSGDNIKFKLCINCGRIQDKFPISGFDLNKFHKSIYE